MAFHSQTFAFLCSREAIYDHGYRDDQFVPRRGAVLRENISVTAVLAMFSIGAYNAL